MKHKGAKLLAILVMKGVAVTGHCAHLLEAKNNPIDRESPLKSNPAQSKKFPGPTMNNRPSSKAIHAKAFADLSVRKWIKILLINPI